MGPIGCPETSVRNHQNSPRSNPEERSSPLLLCGSLKSRIVQEDRSLHQEDVCRLLTYNSTRFTSYVFRAELVCFLKMDVEGFFEPLVDFYRMTRKTVISVVNVVRAEIRPRVLKVVAGTGGERWAALRVPGNSPPVRLRPSATVDAVKTRICVRVRNRNLNSLSTRS